MDVQANADTVIAMMRERLSQEIYDRCIAEAAAREALAKLDKLQQEKENSQ